MSEVHTPLVNLQEGDSFIAEDEAVVITAANTHRDILRYVVADIGLDEVMLHLSTISTTKHTQGEGDARGR